MKCGRLAGLAIGALAALVSCPKPGEVLQPLPAPANITVIVTSPSTARITWSSVEGAEGYNVYRSFTGIDDYQRVNPWLLIDRSYDDWGLPAAMVW